MICPQHAGPLRFLPVLSEPGSHCTSKPTGCGFFSDRGKRVFPPDCYAERGGGTCYRRSTLFFVKLQRRSFPSRIVGRKNASNPRPRRDNPSHLGLVQRGRRSEPRASPQNITLRRHACPQSDFPFPP